MSRPYLTVAEYAAKYGIPKPTVYSWARNGKIHLDRTSYPFLILDEGEAPRKDPETHKWRYIFP